MCVRHIVFISNYCELDCEAVVSLSSRKPYFCKKKTEYGTNGLRDKVFI